MGMPLKNTRNKIHFTAKTYHGSDVDSTATLAFAVKIMERTKIGARVKVFGQTVVGPDTIVLEDAHLFSKVKVGKLVVLGNQSIVHISAIIGDHVIVYPGAEIGSKSQIYESNIGLNSVIGDETEINATIIGYDSYVGNRNSLDDVLMGNNAIIFDNTFLPKGLVVPDKYLVFSAPGASKLFKYLLPLIKNRRQVPKMANNTQN